MEELMSNRPRYYLVTCVGGPSYGDELITATWLRHLAKHAPDAEVFVECVRPELAWPALKGLHPGLRFTDTLWMLCVEHMGLPSAEIADAVTARIVAADRPAGVAELAGSDVVHLVGGGVLNYLYPWTAGLLAGVVAAARESGGRGGMTGQGMCPQDPDFVPRLRDMAAQLSVADARDEPSREMLGLDTLRVTADDVFLGLDASHYRWTDDAPDVMVCAQADIAPMFNGATDAATVAESVLRTLRSWDVPAEEVGFLECFPGVDSEVHDIVKKDLPGVRFCPLMDVLDHGLPVRAGQTWLSTRFHPHLMAASAG